MTQSADAFETAQRRQGITVVIEPAAPRAAS